jgi:hypothetical protein
MSDVKKSVPYASVPEIVELMNAKAKIEPDSKGFIIVKRSGIDAQVKLSNKVISDASGMVDKLIRPHNPKIADEIKKTYEKLKVASGKVGRSRTNPFSAESFQRTVYDSGTVNIPVAALFGKCDSVWVTKLTDASGRSLIIVGPTAESIKGFNPKK